MKRRLFLLGYGFGFVLAPMGIADTTGTINATLTLTTGCLVNGQAAATNVNFGTLDFGRHVATFDTLQASVVGSQGAGINVRCTEGAIYNVQITNSNAKPSKVFGQQSATGARYLIRASDASLGVAYTLYPSASATTPIANNTNIPPAGTPDPVNGDNYPITGRIVGVGNDPTLPTGTYVDTIAVSITY